MYRLFFPLFYVFFFPLVYRTVVCVFLSIFSFPEVEFFQNGNLQQSMTDVLFCYAKDQARLSYKQVCYTPKAHEVWAMFTIGIMLNFSLYQMRVLNHQYMQLLYTYTCIQSVSRIWTCKVSSIQSHVVIRINSNNVVLCTMPTVAVFC